MWNRYQSKYAKRYNTGLCARDCSNLKQCRPGSHISSTGKSCVWHGRNGSSTPKSSPGGLLSSILGTNTTPSYTPSFDFQSNPTAPALDTPTPYAPSFDFQSNPTAPESPYAPSFDFQRNPVDPFRGRTAALEDYMAARRGNVGDDRETQDFGGGGRRYRSRYRRRSSSKSHRRRNRRKSSGKRRTKRGKRRARRS